MSRNQLVIIFYSAILVVLFCQPTVRAAGFKYGCDSIMSYRFIKTDYNRQNYWQWNCKMEVFYSYDPRHGKVIVGAYVEPQGNGLASGHSYWGSNPVEEYQRGQCVQGVQRVNLAVRLEPHTQQVTTYTIKFFLYEKNGTVFLQRSFRDGRVWRHR